METKPERSKEHSISGKAAKTAVKIKGILKSLSEKPMPLIVLVLFIIFIPHLAIALLLKDFTWVASFGALLSIFSIILIASESLFSNLDTDLMNIYLNETPEHIDTFDSSGFSSVIDEKEVESELENRRKKFNVKYKNVSLYLITSVVGTLLWAYSGFLNKFFCVS